MRQPTQLEKSVARLINDEFPQKKNMNRYGSEYGEMDIYIAEIVDNPWENLTSYSTIGLSKYIHHSGDLPVQIEIIGACLSGTENFGNLISSCAFHSMENNYNITYGSCIQGLIDDYYISSCLSHITFVAPVFWETLAKKTVDGIDVLWLMALPISSSEAEYLSKYGIDALEKKLIETNADLTDFERASIV